MSHSYGTSWTPSFTVPLTATSHTLLARLVLVLNPKRAAQTCFLRHLSPPASDPLHRLQCEQQFATAQDPAAHISDSAGHGKFNLSAVVGAKPKISSNLAIAQSYTWEKKSGNHSRAASLLQDCPIYREALIQIAFDVKKLHDDHLCTWFQLCRRAEDPDPAAGQIRMSITSLYEDVS